MLTGELLQAWPRPTRPRPVVVVGAGAIVRTAHLPAYRRLGLPVAGVFDVNLEAARQTAQQFDLPRVFPSLAEAASTPDAVFDVAVPGSQIVPVLSRLPPGAPVLIQKPMGEDLAAARAILALCQAQHLTAAINFQLRFSPNMLALADAIDRGALGTLTDIEVRLVVRQPWENWSFLRQTPRLEVLYHSIHYLDAIRRLAGEPRGVYCRGVSHPLLPDFRDSRSTIILDYGNELRCSLMLNHTHAHDRRHRMSMFKVEGTRGSAVLTMGVNLEYPDGGPDAMELSLAGAPWEPLPLRGSWFTAAFEGPISNLQRVVAGEDAALVSPVRDAIKTMALVEACYTSSAAGGTPIEAV